MIPGFDLIAVVANATPGPDRKFRTRQPDKLIRSYLRAIRSVNGRLILDIQPGRADVSDEVEALEKWIDEPDVDVSIDPEWEVGRHGVPGQTAGKIRAKEINRISRQIQAIVDAATCPRRRWSSTSSTTARSAGARTSSSAATSTSPSTSTGSGARLRRRPGIGR